VRPHNALSNNSSNAIVSLNQEQYLYVCSINHYNMKRKALLLLSGGIDSPVAAHLMQKKGYTLTALHFYNKHISDVNTIEKCQIVCRKLDIKKLIIVPFDEQQAEVVRKCRHKYFYIITRRLMWRIAEKIAKSENAKYLITGENLAQVASQTLSNMATIDCAVSLSILRPLLCNDKNETIKTAKDIETYNISIGPEVCCVLGPKSPATSSHLDKVKHEEQNIDIQNIIKNTLVTAESKHILAVSTVAEA
jgi:tRNA uracil 4-sulfurtransferase